ncbi:arginyltransferase [Rhodocyclus tenuis]|uniref:Aspartate/glutamate leucyltransferase n=1 Tax=Rhodocyclus tenuis TaxID=1066 RepID=A0A6L5JTI9_RHOTE|nr:arginyltransferase [Rhodocyclus gracilis]MQY50351.1 arginyltransferase [Rhodocyclus gracilis]MRD71753.1 arginyltransferase [Rhodocyclus gracilis]
MSRLNDSELPFSLLQFYATAPYACSYLPNEKARSQVATPTHLISTEVYGELVRSGFRRSGVFTYRPLCDTCHACVPVRVAVGRFLPDRSQRRCLKKYAGMLAREVPLAYDAAHFALYQRYQSVRHPGGGMDHDSREQYTHFLLQSRVDTRLVEFSENGVLRMVSIIDVLSDGLSSVYTFYDPDVPGANFGVYNVLWQLDQCATHALPHLYLGYWIHGSRKMAYKSRFQPLQGLIDGEWQSLPQTSNPDANDAPLSRHT